MADTDALREELLDGYSFAKDDGPEPPAALFGRPLTGDLEGVLPDVPVRLPLRMFNRHGLIAGATGTGKTKTLQLFAEQLSEQGVTSARRSTRRTRATTRRCGAPVGSRSSCSA